MSKLDLSKPYQTRGGDNAIAVKPDWGAEFLVGIVKGAGRHSTVWALDGRHEPANPQLRRSEWDLVNIPETRTVRVWINCYRHTGVANSWMFISRGDADAACGADRIACIEREITYTVGEGLDP